MNVSAIGAGAASAFASSAVHRHQPSFSDTAQLLGISASDLNTQLQSGTTLADLAKQKGVSSSDLLSSVEKDLQANAPPGAPKLSGDQLSQMATGLINGSLPSPPSGMAGSLMSGSASSHSSGTADRNLSSLADALGVDPSALLAQLSSGSGLSGLLSSADQTGYGSSAAASVSGGVAFDEFA